MTEHSADTVELKPCPFCGSDAKMMGGPLAQETYSVWCVNARGKRHHLECGTMDERKAAEQWNTRPALTVEDAAKVRIGLIADGLDDGEPEYHEQGMGCGLEDRNITDRYQAMEYGWDQAMERVYGEVIQPASEALRAIADTPKEGE